MASNASFSSLSILPQLPAEGRLQSLLPVTCGMLPTSGTGDEGSQREGRGQEGERKGVTEEENCQVDQNVRSCSFACENELALESENSENVLPHSESLWALSFFSSSALCSPSSSRSAGCSPKPAASARVKLGPLKERLDLAAGCSSSAPPGKRGAKCGHSATLLRSSLHLSPLRPLPSATSPACLSPGSRTVSGGRPVRLSLRHSSKESESLTSPVKRRRRREACAAVSAMESRAPRAISPCLRAPSIHGLSRSGTALPSPYSWCVREAMARRQSDAASSGRCSHSHSFGRRDTFLAPSCLPAPATNDDAFTMVSQPKPLGSCELKERSASAAFRCSSPRSPPYSSVLSSSISSSASASVPFASSSVACLPPADEARQAVALASSSSFLTGGSADSPILSSGEPLPWGVPFSVSSGCSTGAPCAPSVSCSGEMREDESESSKQEPHSSSSISASPEVVSARLPRRRTKRGVKRALSARPSRAAFLVALRRRVRTSASGECVNRASPSAGPPSSSAPGAAAGGLLLLHLARVALLAFDPQKRGRRLRSRSRPQAGAPPATRACTDLSWSPVGVSSAPLPTAGRDTLSRSEARSTADEALDKKRARTAETGEAGEAPRRKSRRGGAARAKAGRADCGAEDAAETSEWGEGGREGKVATSVRGSQATDSDPPEVAVPAPSENSPPTTQGDAPLRGPRQGGRRPACAGVCKTSRSVGSEIVGCGATIKEIGDYLCEHLHQTDSPAFRTNLSRFLQECIDGTFIKRVRRGVYALTAQAVVSSVCSASPFSVFQRSFARSLPLSTGDRTAAVLCRKLALHGGEETKAQQTADAQATATQQGGPYSGAERRCEGAAGRQHKDDETALQREFCDSEATDLQGGGPGGSPAVRAVAAKDPGGSCSRDRDTGKRFGDCSGGEVSREAAARGEREGLAESMTRMDTAETAASSTAEEIESPRCNFESELADEVANPHVVPSESVGRFAGGINKEAGPVAESVVLTCTTSSSWISLTSLASPSSPSSSLPSPLVASGASSVSFPDPYHALAASPSLSSSSSASTLAARVECPSLVFPAALCEQALPAAPAPVSYYLKRPSLDASSADDSSTKLLGRSSFIFASSTLRHAGVRRGSPFSLSAPKQIFGRPALPAQIGFLTLEKKLRGPMRAASCLPAQAAAARLGETASSAGGSCAARGPAAPGEGTDVCCPAGSGEGTRARVGTCRERCVAGRLRKGSAPQHAANGVEGAGLVFGDLSWKRKSVKVEKEVERGAWGGGHPSGGRAAEETNFGETQAKRRRTMRPARGTDAANQAAEVRLEAADAQKAENSGDKGSETGREKPTPKRRGRPPKRAQGVEPVSSDTRVRELCSSAEPQLHHPPDKVAGEPQLGASGAERCRAASFRLPFCALDNLQMKPRRAPGRPHGSVEDLCERVKKHGRELPVTKSESAEERRSAQRRKRGGSGEHRLGEERNPLSGGKQHALRPCLSRKQRDCRQSEKLRREESNGLQSAVVRKRAFDTVEDILHALEFSPRNQKGEDARELEADEAAVSASYPAEGLPPPEGDENERMEKGGALHGRPGRTGERLRRGRRRKAADGDVPAASARVGKSKSGERTVRLLRATEDPASAPMTETDTRLRRGNPDARCARKERTGAVCGAQAPWHETRDADERDNQLQMRDPHSGRESGDTGPGTREPRERKKHQKRVSSEKTGTAWERSPRSLSSRRRGRNAHTTDYASPLCFSSRLPREDASSASSTLSVEAAAEGCSLARSAKSPHPSRQASRSSPGFPPPSEEEKRGGGALCLSPPVAGSWRMRRGTKSGGRECSGRAQCPRVTSPVNRVGMRPLAA